ncbi:homoserine O-succinyltransferase [Ferruginivarius sediminum]|uniref:Homoserine O-acetyltransferase n=1 Tax=Ferruginivarius sediminum TaxID=2661937 RepID=A0A369T754_9PROT|nr:homoserine O-succinyltransferase [Ferruginivarius sediminum]RDD61150.1 homoserine O-succinyltransferase [Ferruginivarius sediminum]
MPIKIPANSPAERILNDEGVELIETEVALRQDIRPLRILLLNLMPIKVATEVQIARLLSHTPMQVELTWLTTRSYTPHNTSREYLEAFYRTLDDVRDEHFDALIVTGAPVERLPFEEVEYWQELLEILDWSERHVFRRLHLCWGAQAALWREFGIDKLLFDEKLFGVFEHRVVAPRHRVLRGFPDVLMVPVSRYSGVRREDIEARDELEILIDSDEAGVCMVGHRKTGDIYMLNHLEYDTHTLKEEYERDLEREPRIAPPRNYFADDGPTTPRPNVWRPLAYLLFSNWNYLLYEDSPYDLTSLSRKDKADETAPVGG